MGWSGDAIMCLILLGFFHVGRLLDVMIVDVYNELSFFNIALPLISLVI